LASFVMYHSYPTSVADAAAACLRSMGALLSLNPLRIADAPLYDRPLSPGQVERFTRLLNEVHGTVSVTSSAVISQGTKPSAHVAQSDTPANTVNDADVVASTTADTLPAAVSVNVDAVAGDSSNAEAAVASVSTDTVTEPQPAS